jgi:hypothetical protein
MDDLHDYVVRSLQTAGKEKWPEIATATEVSVHTIIKVARGIIASPRYRTLAPLAEYFRAHPEPACATPSTPTDLAA